MKVSSFNGFPSYAEFLVTRLSLLVSDFSPVELCNLEYTPERGSSIDPHIDDVWLWGDQLVTINLLDTTILTLSNSQKKTDGEKAQLEEIQIPLVRRSLLVLSSEARYQWQHAIKRHDIRSRRIAMTLRNLSKEVQNNSASKSVVQEIQKLSCSFQGTVVR